MPSERRLPALGTAEEAWGKGAVPTGFSAASLRCSLQEALGAGFPLRCSVLANPGIPLGAPLMTDQVLKLHFRLWRPLLPQA